MLILLDENLLSKKLNKPFLEAGHTVQNVEDMGWCGTKDRELLALANIFPFDVFITSDKNLPTIMVYKFENKSQRKVEKILGITLKETRVYREIKEEGREEGQKSLVLRQLARRVGKLPPEVRQQVESLSLEQLENLGEALLDFPGMSDLDAWFTQL